MDRDLELLLTKKAWEDPEFASLLAKNPHEAMSQLGINVPKNVKLKIIIQQPNTLYFTVPAARTELKNNPDALNSFQLTQMDIWSSGKMFVWICPVQQEWELLQMRNSVYKGNNNE